MYVAARSERVRTLGRCALTASTFRALYLSFYLRLFRLGRPAVSLASSSTPVRCLVGFCRSPARSVGRPVSPLTLCSGAFPARSSAFSRSCRIQKEIVSSELKGTSETKSDRKKKSCWKRSNKQSTSWPRQRPNKTLDPIVAEQDRSTRRWLRST